MFHGTRHKVTKYWFRSHFNVTEKDYSKIRGNETKTNCNTEKGMVGYDGVTGLLSRHK